MTLSGTNSLLGVQRPRVSSGPSFSTSAGSAAVRLAALAKVHLDDWQAHVLEQGLGERQNGRWASREVGLVVPRQNGKGEVLLARELAGLLLFGERLILHTAHEFKTAKDGYNRLTAALERLPEGRRAKYRNSNEEVSVEMPDGAKVRFVARSEGSGRGFSCDTLILDEAYALTPDIMAALAPTQMAVPNPQLWYASSAGMPASETLARVRMRGLTKTGSLAYMEWSAADDADLDDIGAWAQANPAMGVRIDLESLQTARESLDGERFAREHLGIWYDAGKEIVVPAEVWRRSIDPESAPVGDVAFAIEVTPNRRSSAISTAGMRPDGKVHVEVVEQRRGTDWVAPRMRELVDRWKPLAVVVGAAGPAASLLPDLAEAGVMVRTTTSADWSRACGALYDAVTQDGLRHMDDPRLNVALGAARKRVLSLGAWVLHPRAADSDITPLSAAALAMYGLQTAPPTAPKRAVGRARSY